MVDYVGLGQDPYSAHQLILKYALGAGTVLDAGCSGGAIARMLVAQGSVVDGIESDEVAAAEAKRHCRKVLVGDLETMQIDLPPESYDMVVMADVMEHLREPVTSLARLRPLLGRHGRLLVSTPNIANWSMRALHLAGRWDYRERGIMDRTHLRFFTRRTVRETIEAAGYEIVAMDVTCPLPVLRREPFNGVAHWMALHWQNLLAYQFIVLARLAPSPASPAWPAARAARQQ